MKSHRRLSASSIEFGFFTVVEGSVQKFKFFKNVRIRFACFVVLSFKARLNLKCFVQSTKCA